MIELYRGKSPRLAPDVFVARGAVVIGDVTIGAGSSVWYNTVVRGDVGRVTVGKGTNIQDLCMLHMTTDISELIVGDEVTVGHRVVLHGCTVEDRCLVGMGSVILDNAVIGAGSVVASGAVVTERLVIPPNSLVAGMPARVKRTLTDEEAARSARIARHYLELAREHKRLSANRTSWKGAESEGNRISVWGHPNHSKPK
jgi:carbonic anhydrase/acetyltransferase-like protein (isoleucine patch superfamily)